MIDYDQVRDVINDIDEMEQTRDFHLLPWTDILLLKEAMEELIGVGQNYDALAMADDGYPYTALVCYQNISPLVRSILEKLDTLTMTVLDLVSDSTNRRLIIRGLTALGKSRADIRAYLKTKEIH